MLLSTHLSVNVRVDNVGGRVVFVVAGGEGDLGSHRGIADLGGGSCAVTSSECGRQHGSE